MPLIPCPQCKAEISPNAESCPRCGEPMQKRSSPAGPVRVQTQHTAISGVLAIIIGFVVVMVLAAIAIG